jgi:hypothetical protein
VVGPYVITHVEVESGAIIRRAGATSDWSAILPAVHLEFINGRGNSRRGQSRKILGPVTLLGASRQCDFWLRDESVSTVHAGLVLTPDGLWVVDLLGRNGVLVDDRPAYWKHIHDGSLVQIGRFRFRVRFGDSNSRSGSDAEGRGDPEILPAPGRRKSSRGTVSEDSVMAMFQHMTEMQNQFFEQSQVQMQLMAQMLAHLGRSQQDSVRKDLTRIDEIGRELNVIRSQLAGAAGVDVEKQESRGRSRKKRNRRSRRAEAQLHLKPSETSKLAEQSPTPQLAAESPPGVPDRSRANQRPSRAVPESASPPVPGAGQAGFQGNSSPRLDDSQYDADCITPDTTEAHARLTKRMARLAQERNSRWRRVLNAFGRKPE